MHLAGKLHKKCLKVGDIEKAKKALVDERFAEREEKRKAAAADAGEAPEDPDQKPEPWTKVCEICEVTVKGEFNWNNHIKGKRHAKAKARKDAGLPLKGKSWTDVLPKHMMASNGVPLGGGRPATTAREKSQVAILTEKVGRLEAELKLARLSAKGCTCGAMKDLAT